MQMMTYHSFDEIEAIFGNNITDTAKLICLGYKRTSSTNQNRYERAKRKDCCNVNL